MSGYRIEVNPLGPWKIQRDQCAAGSHGAVPHDGDSVSFYQMGQSFLSTQGLAVQAPDRRVENHHAVHEEDAEQTQGRLVEITKTGRCDPSPCKNGQLKGISSTPPA